MTPTLCLASSSIELQPEQLISLDSIAPGADVSPSLVASPTPVAVIEPPTPSASCSALLAVADDVVRGLLAAALVGAGYRVAVAHDGFAALEQLARTDFGLVVLDLHLPRRTGWEVLQGLQRLPARPKVVVTTSQPGAKLAGRVRAAGADELVQRPFSPDDLLLRLARLSPLPPLEAVA